MHISSATSPSPLLSYSSTSHYKIGDRYYDPSLGRWTQDDAINERTDTHGTAQFAYAGDDPVNNVDPTGMCICIIHRVTHAAIAVAGCSLRGDVTIAIGGLAAAGGVAAGGLIVAGGIAEVAAASASTGGAAGPLSAVLAAHQIVIGGAVAAGSIAIGGAAVHKGVQSC